MHALFDDEKSGALVEVDRIEGRIEEEFLQARTPRDGFEFAQEAGANAETHSRGAHVDRLDFTGSNIELPEPDDNIALDGDEQLSFANDAIVRVGAESPRPGFDLFWGVVRGAERANGGDVDFQDLLAVRLFRWS